MGEGETGKKTKTTPNVGGKSVMHTIDYVDKTTTVLKEVDDKRKVVNEKNVSTTHDNRADDIQETRDDNGDDDTVQGARGQSNYPSQSSSTHTKPLKKKKERREPCIVRNVKGALKCYKNPLKRARREQRGKGNNL